MAVLQEGFVGNVYIQETYSADRETTRAGGMSVTKNYILRNKQNASPTGTTLEMDNAIAYAALQSFVLTNMSSLIVDTLEGNIVLPVEKIRTDVDKSNYPVFRGSVTWQFDPRKPNYITQPVTWMHRMTGGTRRHSMPFSPQRYYTKPGVTPFPFAGVNWARDKQAFDGVECYSPEWNLIAKQQLLASLVTMPYLLSLYAMSKTANSLPFYGLPAGSVLYLGADIEEEVYNENQVCNLTHTFVIEPNLVNYNVDGIAVPLKEGHEYQWESAVRTEQGIYVSQVNIAPMYGKSDFSLLGLT